MPKTLSVQPKPMVKGQFFGVHLNASDTAKLKQLSADTEQPASQVLRRLIRLASPTHAAPMRLGNEDDQEK